MEDSSWTPEVNSPLTEGLAQLSSESVALKYEGEEYTIIRYYYYDKLADESFQTPEQWDNVLSQLKESHRLNTLI